MPHECTSCGETFADGSKEMLSGCPNCGGHKFQFRPATGADTDADATPDTDAASEPSPPASSDADPEATSATATEAGTESDPDADANRRWVDQRGETASDSERAPGSKPDANPEAGSATETETSGPENRAQADARRGVVSSDELSEVETAGAAADADPEGEGDAAGTADADADDGQPDLSDLREELNSQFESIRILSPGQYELNLMELYDREEYIISLREDGRYIIEVPETWRGGE